MKKLIGVLTVEFQSASTILVNLGLAVYRVCVGVETGVFVPLGLGSRTFKE